MSMTRTVPGADGQEAATSEPRASSPAADKTQDMDSRVIAAITRVAKDLGVDSLSNGTYMAHRRTGEPSGITAIRRFGTWKKAAQAAGLNPHPYSRGGELKISDTEALSLIRRAASEFSSTTGDDAAKMTQAFYRSWRLVNGGLGLESLVKRYGFWDEVKRHAGLI